MEQLEVTKISSKGQVVLPQAIRQKLRLVEGESMIVLSSEDTVILKRIERPVMDQFKELLKRSRACAKKSGLTHADVKAAIRRVRQSS